MLIIDENYKTGYFSTITKAKLEEYSKKIDVNFHLFFANLIAILYQLAEWINECNKFKSYAENSARTPSEIDIG